VGFWDLLKNRNNAEGIREVMRWSYDKHYELVVKIGLAQAASKVSGDTLSETTQYFALFNTLESRCLARGVPTENAEKLIWAELLPFLYLDENMAREALAEYVVYKEMPKDANISWLETVVQKGCELTKSKKIKVYNAWMPVAKAGGAVWLLLFEGRGNDYFWGDRW